MDIAQVEKQIHEERKQFMSQKFHGTIPDWLFEKLSDCIMSIPQPAVPYRADILLEIVIRNGKDATIFEAGLLCNIFLATKPKIFGWPLEIFLQKRIEMERVRAEYMLITTQEDKRLEKKKNAMLNMGGQANNYKSNGLAKA
jgi:hypothetical protein